MDETLKALLEAGKTPEAIYKDALNIVKEMNEKKSREREKERKNKEARDTLIKALADYITIVTGESIDTKTIKEIEETFKVIEAGTGKHSKCTTCFDWERFFKDIFDTLYL